MDYYCDRGPHVNDLVSRIILMYKLIYISLNFDLRSQTAGSNGLTNVQLKDLYSNCIKLSTENVSKALFVPKILSTIICPFHGNPISSP